MGNATDRSTGTEPVCLGLPARHRNGLTLLIGNRSARPSGIRYNKKAHTSCGSSARMAGNMCANVDQIRRQGRWNKITINGAYLTNLPRKLVRSKAGFPTLFDSFSLHVPLLTHLPASARSCSRRLTNDMTDWRQKSSVLAILFKPTLAENAFVQVIMMFGKTFIQNSVLMMELHPCYPIWQHSIFSDPAYLSFNMDMLQIEAQEHDPAPTLLQQCVPMHSRF
ncbi:hypothetical protein [Absidia glauca]|uniref:Ndc10 domain-containing protein n=1 Tax=Absidia glauca TaxID=4829 RepID=A0A163JZC3_ABSGL|nr:hypothetical protein [Absidia glauca]